MVRSFRALNYVHSTTFTLEKNGFTLFEKKTKIAGIGFRNEPCFVNDNLCALDALSGPLTAVRTLGFVELEASRLWIRTKCQVPSV